MTPQKNEKLSFPELVFFAELVVVALAAVCAILLRHDIVSILLAANYILVTILLVLLFIKKSVYQLNIFLAFAVILVLSFLSMAIYGILSFDYARKWLIFFSLISLYFWAYFTRITQRMINAIMIFGIFQALVFLLAYLYGYAYPLGTVGITFSLGNPNFAGIWLLCVFLLLTVSIEYFENRVAKIALLVLAAAIFYFLLLTNARGSIIPAICYIPVRLLYRKKYSKLLTFCMVISPLVFALVYLALIDNRNVAEFFSFMISEGKTLNSRVGIWERGFDLFVKYPILGNYYESTYGTGISQYHNIYVDTLCTYGLIVQTAVIAFMTWILNGIGKHIKSGGFSLAAITAFYFVIVSGCFEAALFASSQGVYVLSGTLLLLARYQNNQKVLIKS